MEYLFHDDTVIAGTSSTLLIYFRTNLVKWIRHFCFTSIEALKCNTSASHRIHSPSGPIWGGERSGLCSHGALVHRSNGLSQSKMSNIPQRLSESCIFGAMGAIGGTVAPWKRLSCLAPYHMCILWWCMQWGAVALHLRASFVRQKEKISSKFDQSRFQVRFWLWSDLTADRNK